MNHRCLITLSVILLTTLVGLGCQRASLVGPAGEANSDATPSAATGLNDPSRTATVRLSLDLAATRTANVLPVRADGTTEVATISVELRSINLRQPSQRLTTFRTTARLQATTTATLELLVPAQPTVGYVALEGVALGDNYTLFRGAADLVPGPNNLIVHPASTALRCDVVAWVLEQVVADDAAYALIQPGVVGRLTAMVQGIDRQREVTLVYQDAADAVDAQILAGTGTGTGSGTGTGTATSRGLLITEISSVYYANDGGWIEIYNDSDQTVQLANYTVRSTAIPNTGGNYTRNVQFTLPSLAIAPRTYIVVRGRGSDKIRDGGRLVTVLAGTSLVPMWTDRFGAVELLRDGATVDFVVFNGDTAAPTTAGHWSGGPAPTLPKDSVADLGKSLARPLSLPDTNTAADWVLRQFSTPGGPNDVTDDTDADADGIPDTAEVQGGTYAGLPLYDWGARTGRRDIFVHIDHMDSADLGVIPQKASLDKIVAAFAARDLGIHFDVGNLFGAPGAANHNLDDRSHRVPFSTATWLGVADGKANVYQYKADHLDVARRQIFHYVLFAYSDQLSGARASASGRGELNGNDLFLTMGNSNFRTDTENERNWYLNSQAMTLMHELGHNLGLEHGGNDNLNYKPNYRSIMNYLYGVGLPTVGTAREGDRYYYYRYSEIDGFSDGSAFARYFPRGTSDLVVGPYTTDLICDYSDGRAAPLNEASLNEPAGLGYSNSAPVDWNGDGDTIDTGLAFNLNPSHDSVLTAMTDFDDWSAIAVHFMRTTSGNSSIRASHGGVYGRPDFVLNDAQPLADCTGFCFHGR